MEVERNSLSPADVEEINRQASIFMKQGIRLVDDDSPEAVGAALGYFDRALELRRGLPIEAFPVLRYDFAACWLNRGDVLMRLGNSEQMQSALCAYDEGIALLRDLPLHEDWRFPRRLAIAHQNRGLALQSHDTSAIATAVEEFAKAIEVLEHEQSAQIPDRLYLLAAVWMNLANVRLAEESSQSERLAEEAARRAITLVTSLETDDVHSAEVGMKARHVLCQAIAQRLSQIPNTHAKIPEAVHEATDAADTGLALARRWEKSGVESFRPIARDLFLFGMRVYAKYQPQFLAEFVSENEDPTQSSFGYVESEEMRFAAREAYEIVSHMEQ